MNLKNKPSCKGLIFRGYNNSFFDYKTKRFENKVGFRLLKRKSCKGCEQCWCLLDCLCEGTDNVIYKEVKNNKLYTLIITNILTDYESGHVDDFDLEFKEIPPVA